MTSALPPRCLLSILLLCGCQTAEPPPPVSDPAPIQAPATAPAPQGWPHPWQWAAVVRIEPAQATVQELSGLDATVSLPLDQTIMRDALRDSPVSVWRAPPGAELTVRGGAPDVAEQHFSFTLPAELTQATWVVASDLGVHAQQWEDAHVVHEVQIAAGLEPWRVMISVGGDALLDEVKRDQSLRTRLREHGVVVTNSQDAGEVQVPWADLPLSTVTLPAVDSMAGPTFFLATPDRQPRAVSTVRPVVLLEAAGGYFGLELVPQKAGRHGSGAGEGASGGDDQGAARPARSKRGKAGRRPSGPRNQPGARGG